MTLEKKFRKSLEKQYCLRFETSCADSGNYSGVVTHITDDFIVLKEMDDFAFDGILIFPKESLVGCRDGRSERCTNEILRFNGQINNIRTPRWLNLCRNLADLFQQFNARDIWPAVSSVYEDKELLYLGPITEPNEEGFVLRCYDVAGKWEKKYLFTYPDVFRIMFDSNYDKRFNAFMKAKAKK